tara:strand:+ start:12858 stop:13112 length:255 start_codon:yes stop_codon:yes gene_type:complete
MNTHLTGWSTFLGLSLIVFAAATWSMRDDSAPTAEEYRAYWDEEDRASRRSIEKILSAGETSEETIIRHEKELVQEQWRKMHEK